MQIQKFYNITKAVIYMFSAFVWFLFIIFCTLLMYIAGKELLKLSWSCLKYIKFYTINLFMVLHANLRIIRKYQKSDPYKCKELLDINKQNSKRNIDEFFHGISNGNRHPYWDE